MSWKEILSKMYEDDLFYVEEVTNFIEALIKETEQNTAKEIFDEIRHSLSCYSKIIYTEYGTTNENIVYQAINEFDLEQLREKYTKGVE